MRLKHLFLMALSGLPVSCSTDEQAVQPPPATVASSARGNLRFKGPERLASDIAAALELSPEAVCTELGLYQCTSMVHNVALGGVDPYGTGLYEASGITSLTTPLVVERVVLSACLKRVEADLADPSAAVVFGGIPVSAGKLASPDGAEVRSAIVQLTQRALQRDPYENEVARFVQLAKDIEATGTAEPARAFMQASCYAILSLPEAVFY